MGRVFGLPSKSGGNSSAIVLSRSILMSTSRARTWLASVDRWVLASEPSATRQNIRSAKIGIWVGAEGELASSTIKVVESEALTGVLGSGNWSRDSRGARGSHQGIAPSIFSEFWITLEYSWKVAFSARKFWSFRPP